MFNQKVTKIRPVIGANGAGKTTLLKFQVKDNLEALSPEKRLFLFFDFKAVANTEEEFWRIFIQNLIDQLYNEDPDKNTLRKIINRIPESKRTFDLFKIFRNKRIVENIQNLCSLSENDQLTGLMYFNGDELSTKDISDIFYGIVQLSLSLDYLIVITFDEIQYLNEIDEKKTLLKIFLEKFIRYFMEKFSSEKLYIIVSCLENPDLKEWTQLIESSKNFETLVKNKEIKLGNLTTSEKNEIINQVADKIGFESEDRKRFLSKVKSSLMFYLPRDLLKCIAGVIDSMDYIGYTDYDIRQIYEEDARNHIKEVLSKKGFVHLDSDVKRIGGFDVDIYATAATNRTGYVKKALGEVTIMRREGMKGKIEKFANWLLRMKTREYKPEKGDLAFFICPPGRITPGSKEILEANQIELYEFVSPNVDQLLSQKKSTCEEEASDGETDIEVQETTEEKEKPLTFVKESKYSLSDIPGIGPAKVKSLKTAKIHTIKDLLNCNVKIIAKQVKGVGEASLNKWRQHARQILSD